MKQVTAEAATPHPQYRSTTTAHRLAAAPQGYDPTQGSYPIDIPPPTHASERTMIADGTSSLVRPVFTPSSYTTLLHPIAGGQQQHRIITTTHPLLRIAFFVRGFLRHYDSKPSALSRPRLLRLALCCTDAFSSSSAPEARYFLRLTPLSFPSVP